MKKKVIIVSLIIMVLSVLGFVFMKMNKTEETDKYWTVTFELVDENEVINTSIQKVKDGEVIKDYSVPELENKVFLGWYLNDELFNFDTVITKDITLKSKFKEKEVGVEYFKVSFDSDGGSSVDTQEVEANGKVTKPSTPAKAGYNFVEWRLDGKAFDFDSPITKDITLKAEWTNKKMYTVSFNSNGGSTVSSQTVEENTSASRPSNPSRSGYRFTGWTLNGSAYNFGSKVTSNITLTANWSKINYYTVSFNSNGGSIVSSQTVEENTNASKPADPSRSGYRFTGWTLNGSAYNFGSKVTSNITLTANWSKINYYTVSFNSNGGSAVSSQTVEENTSASKPSDPTRNGYRFTGWTLNGSAYNFGSKVTSNVTLTANWSEINYYTVSFNSNGGSSVDNQVIVEGNSATKPTNPTKVGFNFTGWTLNGNAYNFSSAVTSNITLVAGWAQKTYTFTYTPVEALFPTGDQIVKIYENGTEISGWSFNIGFNVTSSSPYLNYYDIIGVNSIEVSLTGGTTKVAATKQ